MLVLDSGNPTYIASAVGAVVSFAKGVGINLLVPDVILSGSAHLAANPLTRANYNSITGFQGGVTLAGVVAGDTVIINGVTYTAVASGATGPQFNVGGNDSITASNLVTAFNANQVGNLTSGLFLPGALAKVTLSATIAGSGALSATVTPQISQDGKTGWMTHPGQAAFSLSGTGADQKSGGQIDAYPFMRFVISALTGTGARVLVNASTQIT
jgi:hypothetical protein